MPNPRITLDAEALDDLQSDVEDDPDSWQWRVLAQAREAIELERENVRLRGWMLTGWYCPVSTTCHFCGAQGHAINLHHTPDCPIPPMKEQQERATQEHDGS